MNNPKKIKNFSSTTRKYSKTLQQQPGKIQRQIKNIPKVFKDFFASKIVLAANQQYSENIQILSEQQQQSTSATNSGNQQRRPAAATSSSNEKQQPAAATSSSNQQQQLAAAINSSKLHQQSAFILPAAPTQ